MGIGFGILIIIWCVFTFIALSFLIYTVIKKKTIGIIISSVCFLFLISFYFTNNIAEIEFSTDDVKNDLKFLNVNLKDNFEIISNEVSGMPERNQETKILISRKDSDRIIDEIKNEKNFKIRGVDAEGALISTQDEDKMDEILNYKYPDFYSKELYKINDGFPNRFFLHIEEKSDTLQYQKFED